MVFEKFKTLRDEDKNALAFKHYQVRMFYLVQFNEKNFYRVINLENFQDVQDSLKQQQIFKDNLSEERKTDYLAWKLKTKKTKLRQPKSKADINILDESDIKLELLEDNGLNESESEKESLSPNSALSPKKLNGTVKDNKFSSELNEFISKGPRKPEK